MVRQYGTDAVRGLMRAEAARRLRTEGSNALSAAARIPAWCLLLAPGKNVLIVILLVAIGTISTLLSTVAPARTPLEATWSG